MDIEAAMKRIPPHSAEAEQAVLGAMLMNKEAVMVASEIISGEDFYQTAYGILFDAMVELFHKGKSHRSDHPPGTSEREGCAAGSQQHGICKRSCGGNTDIGQC